MNGTPRTTEEFEDVLAEYMDRFTEGRTADKRTFQEQASSLWDWWRDGRNYLVAQRLARISAERRDAGNCPRA